MVLDQSTKPIIYNLNLVGAAREQVVHCGLAVSEHVLLELLGRLARQTVCEDKVCSLRFEDNLHSGQPCPLHAHPLVVPRLGVPLNYDILVVVLDLARLDSLALALEADHQFWLPAPR